MPLYSMLLMLVITHTNVVDMFVSLFCVLKVKLYSGEDDLDMQELERALTIVRRKYEDSLGNASKDPTGFLTNADEEPLDSLPAVRRKLQQAQVCALLLILLLHIH
jgi:hypothetical protein